VIQATTKEWTWDHTFTGAGTDVELEDLPDNHSMVVLYCQVTCANSNSVDVGIRAGFGEASLPAIVMNSAVGKTGVFLSHAAIARGGGAVVANGGAAVAISEPGQKLFVNLSVAPTGGQVRFVLTYRIQEVLPVAA
jgi:hypothetical protein